MNAFEFLCKSSCTRRRGAQTELGPVQAVYLASKEKTGITEYRDELENTFFMVWDFMRVAHVLHNDLMVWNERENSLTD